MKVSVEAEGIRRAGIEAKDGASVGVRTSYFSELRCRELDPTSASSTANNFSPVNN